MGSSPSRNKTVEAKFNYGVAKTEISKNESLTSCTYNREVSNCSDEISRDRRIKAKIQAFASFMKCSPSVYRLFYQPKDTRQELLAWVKSLKRQSEMDWQAIKEAKALEDQEATEGLGTGRPCRLKSGRRDLNHERSIVIDIEQVSGKDRG